MRLSFVFDGVFLGVNKTDYVSKQTGQPGSYYDVAIKQGGEVGNVSCVKDIYDMYVAGQLKDYIGCRFDCSYDDRFNRLQVTDVHVNK